jgi:hypothetical protein
VKRADRSDGFQIVEQLFFRQTSFEETGRRSPQPPATGGDDRRSQTAATVGKNFTFSLPFLYRISKVGLLRVAFCRLLPFFGVFFCRFRARAEDFNTATAPHPSEGNLTGLTGGPT